MPDSESQFSRVYEEHVWHVYGFIAYRLQSRELAEDLTQTTFERALRGWAKFDPRRASERTWLLAIARNLLIDHYRRQRPEVLVEPGTEFADSTPGPEAGLESWPELGIALAALPDLHREVIALRYGADLTGPEIAEVLGISLANVQQITSRSLKRLRTALQELGVSRPESS